jgi:hypothetical protein
MDETKKELASAERRNFLKLASTGSFTAALVAGAGGMLWSDQAAAQTAAEERDREAAAEHIMTLATAYVLGASRSYPIMQLDLKENIQNATNGKVYVRLAPVVSWVLAAHWRRPCRAAPSSARSTRCRTSHPSRRSVDLINLPYFCGSNQRFTNLVTFRHVEVRGRSQDRSLGLQGAVLHRDRSARGCRPPAGGNAIITPGDMAGVKFRVPGSADAAAVLPHGRRKPDAGGMGRNALGDQAGRGRRARPVGRRAARLRLQARSSATSPSPRPCRTVRSIRSIWSGSTACRPMCRKASSSPAKSQQHQNLSKVPSARSYAMSQLPRRASSSTRSPTTSWPNGRKPAAISAASGTSSRSTSPATMDTFALEEAAGTMGRYYVHDA